MLLRSLLWHEALSISDQPIEFAQCTDIQQSLAYVSCGRTSVSALQCMCIWQHSRKSACCHLAIMHSVLSGHCQAVLADKVWPPQVSQVNVTAKALLPSTSVISFTLGGGLSFTTFVNTVPISATRTINRFALIRKLNVDPIGAAIFNASAWDSLARQAMIK